MEPEPEPGAWLSSSINEHVSDSSEPEVGLGIDMSAAQDNVNNDTGSQDDINMPTLQNSIEDSVPLIPQDIDNDDDNMDVDVDLDLEVDLDFDFDHADMPPLTRSASPSPTARYSPDMPLEMHRVRTLPTIPQPPTLPFHSNTAVTRILYSIYNDLRYHLAYLQQLHHALPWSRTWTRASFGAALADNTGEKVLWVEIQVQLRRIRGRGINEGSGRVFSARIMSWDWEHGSNGLTGGNTGERAGERLIAGPCGWSEVSGQTGYADWEEDREPTLNEVVALLSAICEGGMVDGEVHFHAEVQIDRSRIPTRERVVLSETALRNLRRGYGPSIGGLRVPDRILRRESGPVTVLGGEDGDNVV